MRATHLLVKNHVEEDRGEKCCICGCGTSATLKGKDFFGDTFRDYREMQARLSPYICSMCALSLKDVPSGVVTYLDGSQKLPRSAMRGLGWRFFSWYLVEGEDPVGATKAHCKELREVMRHPPVGKRFAIIIADSGQKQLIYRLEAQRIARDGMPYLVQFEAEQVLIDEEFWRMLNIADMLASVIGKTRILADLKRSIGAHITGIRAEESAKRARRVRVFGLETENSFAPLAYLTAQDVFAYLEEHGLPVHPVYAMTGGGRWDKYRLRVSAIGNPEGRGVGRLVWEREYYGDVLNRMGKTLWQREYDV